VDARGREKVLDCDRSQTEDVGVSDDINPARLLGKLRWANVSEAERREWSKAAHAKRWGKRRKRLHARAKAKGAAK
jgi:hypothetical protein